MTHSTNHQLTGDSEHAEWLFDDQEKARLNAAIREGETDIAAGRVYPADEVMAELAAEFGFSDELQTRFGESLSPGWLKRRV